MRTSRSPVQDQPSGNSAPSDCRPPWWWWRRTRGPPPPPSDRGAALVVDAGSPAFDGALDRAIMRLVTDPIQRAHLSEAAAGVCDGQGADRAAEALLEAIGRKAQAG